MSSLGCREWSLWINKTYFDQLEFYPGSFECIIHDSLMARQTVEFIAQKFSLKSTSISAMPYSPEIKQSHLTDDGHLCIRIESNLMTKADLNEQLSAIEDFIRTLGLCTDNPLILAEIRFNAQYFGTILTARRSPISRLSSFRNDERSSACQKIDEDFFSFKGVENEHVKAGIRHYMTGLTLLSLEDQFNGLIDAAFMQFYQGCEVLCKDLTGRLPESKQEIARLGLPEGCQVIAHQVWRVRNKYYGHGDVSYNGIGNRDEKTSKKVASQALVARYLCRVLIDAHSESKKTFIREMGFASGTQPALTFYGDIESLNGTFCIEYDKRTCDIYDGQGKRIKEITICNPGDV